MQRLKIVLSVSATLALAAAIAPGAQAGQLGNCGKVAKNAEKKYTGNYTDKYCTMKSATKEGKYEWEPDTKEIPQTGEGGESKLTSAAGAITCKKGKSTGKFINASESRLRITFEECTSEPAKGVVVPCQNTATKGEIVTNELHSKMVDFPEMVTTLNEAGEASLVGPKEKEVWSDVFTEGGPSAEFECTLFTVKTFGSTAGVIQASYVGGKLKAGKPGKKGPGTGKPTFKEEFLARGKGGAQALVSEICGEKVKEKTGKECVSVPSVQEGTGEVFINPLEKGLEIDAI
jgi:hypothetical protein